MISFSGYISFPLQIHTSNLRTAVDDRNGWIVSVTQRLLLAGKECAQNNPGCNYLARDFYESVRLIILLSLSFSVSARVC